MNLDLIHQATVENPVIVVGDGKVVYFGLGLWQEGIDASSSFYPQGTRGNSILPLPLFDL